MSIILPIVTVPAAGVDDQLNPDDSRSHSDTDVTRQFGGPPPSDSQSNRPIPVMSAMPLPPQSRVNDQEDPIDDTDHESMESSSPIIRVQTIPLSIPNQPQSNQGTPNEAIRTHINHVSSHNPPNASINGPSLSSILRNMSLTTNGQPPSYPEPF